jgi:FOG: GGDEF domain
MDNNIVNSLKENNGLSNYICRMGGDEFAIIFPFYIVLRLDDTSDKLLT